MNDYDMWLDDDGMIIVCRDCKLHKCNVCMYDLDDCSLWTDGKMYLAVIDGGGSGVGYFNNYLP